MPVRSPVIREYPKSIADLDRLFRSFKISTDPNTVGTDELQSEAVTTSKVAGATAASNGSFYVKEAGALVFRALTNADIPAELARDTEVSAADAVVASDAADALAAHEAAADPHTQYIDATELTAALAALNLASGVYTPTRSAEANLDSNVTLSQAQYLRVGGVVTVSGRFTADPTLTATTTSFEGTLPVASNIGAAEDVAGVAFCGNIVSQGAEIIGVAANDTFKVQWKAEDVTSQTWSYQFSYRVV